MRYYVSQEVSVGFDEAVDAVVEALKTQGFGILTDIDVQATLKAKLGADFRKYRILGACNPPFAQRALELEDKIGLMLPCNVIIQETADGAVEIAAIDPVASMLAVGNPTLGQVAAEVRKKLVKAIEAVGAA